MRIENTTPRQIDVTVDGRKYEFPRRENGVNGAREMSEADLAKAKKDPIVAHWFGSGELKEVKPGFESKPPAPTEEELAAAAEVEAQRREAEKVEKANAELLAAAQKQSEGSKVESTEGNAKDKKK